MKLMMRSGPEHWLMRVPRFGKRHRMLRGRFSHIDLVPTLLDLMGKPMPGRFPGRSLVPVIERGGPSRSGDKQKAVTGQWPAKHRGERSHFRDLTTDPWPLEAVTRDATPEG